MARVYGPIASTQAAGSIAGSLTFARRGRSITAYALTRPSQPQTAHQKGRRIMFTFLGSQWPFLSPVDQQTWSPNFSGGPATAFLHYMQVNLSRWTNHKGPSQASPPTEATSCAKIDSFNMTPHQGYVDFTFRQFAGPVGWAWLLYRSPAWPYDAAPQNCVKVWPYLGSGVLNAQDAGVPPGTYNYWLANTSKDGKLLVWTKALGVVVP